MHPAIRTIRVGRGLGLSDVPVFDLALIGEGKSWHVQEPGLTGKTICGAKGTWSICLSSIDVHTVRIDGHALCGRCRKTLGPLPFSSLVRPPIGKDS